MPRILESRIPIRQHLKTQEADLIHTETGKAIALVIADLGLKTMPDSLAQKRMIHYLINYYQDLSFEEIVKAFELALVGKFEVNTEHYDSFDIKYLTRILNAYRVYRNELTRKLKPTLQIPEHKPTETEKRNSRIQFFQHLEKTYQEFLKTGKLNILVPWLVYNRLLNYNILHISEARWNQLMEQAGLKYQRRLQEPKNLSQQVQFKLILETFEQAKHNYPFELSRIRNIAKEIAVENYFENLKNTQSNFNEILAKSDVYE